MDVRDLRPRASRLALLGLCAGLLPWAMACSPALHDGLTEPGLPGLGLPRAVALSTAAPAQPSAQEVQALVDSIPGPGADTSVPSASDTFAVEAAASIAANSALAGQDKLAAAAVPSAMTPVQQSNAMPMPGQANSHSTPSTHPPSASGQAASAQR